MHEISEGGLKTTFVMRSSHFIVMGHIILLSLKMRTSQGTFSCISQKLQRKGTYVHKIFTRSSAKTGNKSTRNPRTNSVMMAAQAKLAVSAEKGGMYIDGHKHEDVVEYRKGFIKCWKEYEK
jgi:hypothetical protein